MNKPLRLRVQIVVLMFDKALTYFEQTRSTIAPGHKRIRGWSIDPLALI